MSEKQGDLNKCPACGALVPAFATHCEECSYEFRNVGANSSVVDLSNRIDAVYRECDRLEQDGMYDYTVDGDVHTNENKKDEDLYKKLCAVITNFPVPNTREDILELLHFILPKIQLNTTSDRAVFAWRQKYVEIISRAKVAYKNDNNMLAELALYEKQLDSSVFSKIIAWFKSLSSQAKIGLILGICMIGLAIFLSSLSNTHCKGVQQENERLSQQLEKINDAIDDENYKKALRLCSDLYWEYEDSYTRSDTDLLKEQWEKKHDEMVRLIEEQMR